jgi:hypothetical protein
LFMDSLETRRRGYIQCRCQVSTSVLMFSDAGAPRCTRWDPNISKFVHKYPRRDTNIEPIMVNKKVLKHKVTTLIADDRRIPAQIGRAIIETHEPSSWHPSDFAKHLLHYS